MERKLERMTERDLERVVRPAPPPVRDRLIAGVTTLALITLVVLAVKPVPGAVRGRCDVVTGSVESVRASNAADLELRLVGDPHVYHVHGARGVDVANWRERLTGHTVELQTIRRTWSPLDPRHVMAPVAQVSQDGEVLFAAFD